MDKFGLIDCESELSEEYDIDDRSEYGWSDVRETLTNIESQAYMLVYIRDEERSNILETDKEIDMELPKHIIERFDHENSMKQEIREFRDNYESLLCVYIVSQETVED